MADDQKEFTVKDHRAFSQDSADAEARTDGKPAAVDGEPETAASKTGPDETATAESHLPAINFATFIFSLNSSALFQLGMIEDPGTGKKTRNLPMAKQTIDILGMLEEKTRGNLTGDEENMLKHMLYDLRMLYVKELG